jgi:nucleoside-diphosphate-sugar epimerase
MGPVPRRSGGHAARTLPQAVPQPAGRPVPSARGVPRLGAGHRLLLSPTPLPHPAALLGRKGADPQESPGVRVLITGGAGYIGLLASERLLGAGRDVTVLDSLLHGQVELAERLEEAGARVLRGDVRDSAVRADALVDVGAVVHLAAIVGDPACARDPDLSQAVNVEGTKTLAAEAGEVGVERFIFASTCSNYGRMSDPAVPVDESAPLAPVSLYAEQKVNVEQWLLGSEHGSLAPTCLRFATVYGAAPRMRFDLTVNEFTRDLWAGHSL